MTTLFVCAVFDSAVQAYGRPLFMPAKGAAVRAFIDEVNREAPDNSLNKHPADFELRLLAMFNEETGVFSNSEEGPELLTRGKDVKHDAP